MTNINLPATSNIALSV